MSAAIYEAETRYANCGCVEDKWRLCIDHALRENLDAFREVTRLVTLNVIWLRCTAYTGSRRERDPNNSMEGVMREFETRIIDVMVYENIIPAIGLFQIDEHQLAAYIKLYGEIFGDKKAGLKNRNEYKFARKLAGRTLVRLLLSRGVKINQIRAGMVYMISNKAFPLHYKIGMTMDVIDRLSQYQTYDPYRGFKLEKYNFVLDRRRNESLILQHPNIDNETGEWVLRNNAEEIFLQITNNA